MTFTKCLAVVATMLFLAGCANTIRGVGRDTANAVDASVDAVQNVAGAAN